MNLFRRYKLRLFGHAEVFTTGEDDVARRIINTGDHGVSSAGFDERTSGGEIGSGKGFNGGERGAREQTRLAGGEAGGIFGEGLLNKGVVGFRENDFHEVIIACWWSGE